jgi:two-component system phosphate regulon response regulator PhoB
MVTHVIDQFRPPRVLIVDDDASLRLLCRVNLELEGYRVVEAQSVAEAESVLAAETVDLVLLDVHIGADDGIALMRSLREREHTAAVVLFTGSAHLDRTTRAEADGVLAKPFRLEELFDVVHGLARRSATGR